MELPLGLHADADRLLSRDRAADDRWECRDPCRWSSRILLTSATHVGLVAAFSFNAGSGNIVADSTAITMTGRSSNATWTSSGRFGTERCRSMHELWYVPNASN